MTNERKVARTSGVLEAQVDGDRVLMHPDDFAYYGLTPTGVAVWSLIDGTRSVDDIVEVLTDEYAGEPESIRADVLVFMAGLDSSRLITYAD